MATAGALPTQPRNNHCNDSEPGRRTSTAADALTTHIFALHQPVLKLRAPPSMATTVGTPLTQLRAAPSTTTATVQSPQPQLHQQQQRRQRAVNPRSAPPPTITVTLPTTTAVIMTRRQQILARMRRQQQQLHQQLR
ncbi:hypothetical protein EDB85DRAFT_2158281 [Lactarius pseudohatsudake]|nr:hypothetical protein EDB85DRAFT_2158281 [Lactarius pseudohatsudake]